MRKINCRLAIIGAGPGGYVAAIRAAQLGMGVCLIEKAEVGGICLNWGCIPTKALVASARAMSLAKRAAEFGLEIDNLRPNWARMQERKDQVVQRLVKGVHFLIEKKKINLIRGEAAFLSPKELRVTTSGGLVETVKAEKIIIATGSVPTVPETFQYDGKQVLNSNDLLTLPTLPQSMVVIGGGVIGCEFASIFNAFGVKVTIIELMDSLIPGVDSELSSMLRLQFKKRNIEVMTGIKVKEVSKTDQSVTVITEDGKTIDVEKALVSIGRKPNSKITGLSETGMELTPGGRIKVNQYLETNLPGIYAVGDVNDQPWDLAHAASDQGITAVEHIAGIKRAWSGRVVPNCIFTDPEIATVGMSLTEAESLGLEVDTAKIPFLANGKAVAEGESGGFVKVVAAKSTGQLLGVQIIGLHASDLIAEAALAVKHGLTVDEVIHTIHAHPTLAEAFHEAAEGILGLSIHV